MVAFVCPRCGNKEEKYIGYKNGVPYCRKCISFRGDEAPQYNVEPGAVVVDITYPLSADQKRISDRLVENYKNGIDSLINAVCGAGKTELVFALIAYVLSIGRKVAFVIPRRDVVIELYVRLKNVFTSNKVVAVYGGSTSTLTGDIIVLTAHQLYRYPACFDLIIMDEIDAFPYKDNDVLEAMFVRALKGNYVLMSATPSKDILQKFAKPNKEILTLNTRFHRNPLPVPKLVIRFGYFRYMYLIKKLNEYKKERKPVLIFAPTIDICEEVFKLINPFVKKGSFVHSKCINRSETIEKFKSKKFDYLVTTAVLERGVTIKNLQVIIFDADHKIYDEFALIQIAGRVGRKIDAPKGEVVFLAGQESKAISKAIDTIASKNLFL